MIILFNFIKGQSRDYVKVFVSSESKIKML